MHVRQKVRFQGLRKCQLLEGGKFQKFFRKIRSYALTLKSPLHTVISFLP
jgi:hypothetical protein